MADRGTRAVVTVTENPSLHEHLVASHPLGRIAH
jgi:hypothetical protein